MKLNTELLLDNVLNEGELDKKATREAFGSALVELGASNDKIVVVNADLEGSLKVDAFKEKYPERFYQVGVAEQIMAGVGTGLALYGKIPFITSFAAFSPGLNWSHIRLAAMSHANLKVASSHYGLNVGEDGASAQMLEDLALMRVLPGFTVVVPGDFNQTLKAVMAVVDHEGPVYLRLTRDKFPTIFKPESSFSLSQAQVLNTGEDLTIVACGSLVYEALKAAETLESEGLAAEVINLHTIKPLDVETIRASVAKTGKLLLVEEHEVAGGMGSAVLEALSPFSADLNFAYGFVAVQDKFGESGPGREVMKKYGLDRINIVEQGKKLGHGR